MNINANRISRVRRPGRGTTLNAYNAVAGICGLILSIDDGARRRRAQLAVFDVTGRVKWELQLGPLCPHVSKAQREDYIEH